MAKAIVATSSLVTCARSKRATAGRPFGGSARGRKLPRRAPVKDYLTTCQGGDDIVIGEERGSGLVVRSHSGGVSRRHLTAVALAAVSLSEEPAAVAAASRNAAPAAPLWPPPEKVLVAGVGFLEAALANINTLFSLATISRSDASGRVRHSIKYACVS